MRRLTSVLALVLGVWLTAAVSSVQTSARQAPPPRLAAAATTPQGVLNQYCVMCHNQRLRTAGLVLDTLDAAQPQANAEVWERVIGKLRARSMPPAGLPRPDAATYRAVATALEGSIDQ